MWHSALSTYNLGCVSIRSEPEFGPPPSSFFAAGERRRRLAALHETLEDMQVADVEAWSAEEFALRLFGPRSGLLEAIALLTAVKAECDVAIFYPVV